MVRDVVAGGPSPKLYTLEDYYTSESEEDATDNAIDDDNTSQSYLSDDPSGRIFRSAYDFMVSVLQYMEHWLIATCKFRNLLSTISFRNR